MNIVLAYNNFKESIVLPILPAELALPLNMRMNEEFELFSGINGVGKLNIAGNRDLKLITLTSFFPNRNYSFAKSKLKGLTCVNRINKWANNKNPIRLIITTKTDELLNMACLIESFEYAPNRAGDFDYTLTLKEFPFVR